MNALLPTLLKLIEIWLLISAVSAPAVGQFIYAGAGEDRLPVHPPTSDDRFTLTLN